MLLTRIKVYLYMKLMYPWTVEREVQVARMKNAIETIEWERKR